MTRHGTHQKRGASGSVDIGICQSERKINRKMFIFCFLNGSFCALNTLFCFLNSVFCLFNMVACVCNKICKLPWI